MGASWRGQAPIAVRNQKGRRDKGKPPEVEGGSIILERVSTSKRDVRS